MKKMLLILPVFILQGAFAHAYDLSSPACEVIKKACDAGGYKPGGFLPGYKVPKKAPKIDCVKKIVEGETVPGISVSPITITSCKAKKGAKATNKK